MAKTNADQALETEPTEATPAPAPEAEVIDENALFGRYIIDPETQTRRRAPE